MTDADNKGPPRGLGKIIRGPLPGNSSELEAIASSRLPIRSSVVTGKEFEAHSKAKNIVEEAQQKAQNIIEEAQQQAQELLDEAERQRELFFQGVREEASAEGMAQAAAELAKAKMQAGSILAEATPELIELACRISEKIIGRDLEREPSLLLEICANAIENLRTAKAMLLRVHPKDAKLLRERRPELVELIGRSVDIAIRDDAEVQPGGCIVQTEFGVIDAQLETQFKTLRTLFEEEASRKAD
jgi:type III secretion protein L